MKNNRKKGLPLYPGAIPLYSKLSLFIVLETIAIIAQAYFLSRAISHLFIGEPITQIGLEITLFGLSFLARYLLQQLEMFLSENHARHTVKYLRRQLFQHHFSSAENKTSGAGHFVTLAMEGIDHIKKYMEIIGMRTIKSMVTPMMIAIFVFTMDRQSSYILVLAVPIIIIFMILLGLAAQKMADKQYKTFEHLSNHFMDSLKGLETLAYIGKSRQHGQQIEVVSEDYRQATMKTLKVAFLSSFALDFFTSLSIAFVAVGLGIRLVDGSILLFPALTILLLVPEYFSPIKQIGKDYHATLDGQVALADIEQFLAEDALTFENETIKWRPESQLELRHITVSKAENTILNQVNLNLNRGFHGLIGRSGAGKTTLLNVLAGRLNIDSGDIVLNGQPMTSLANDSWYSNLAYIPQQPYIFPMSLKDNLRFYEPSAPDSLIESVVEQIGLKEFVDALPQGLEEKIGEGGRAVSGGQAQRIALARALVSQKEIILLDEPTAHLDIETEYEVKQLILSLFKKRTVVIATHRLHWLQDVDRVTRLTNGQNIAEAVQKRRDKHA